jgi:hypothetical protein
MVTPNMISNMPDARPKTLPFHEWLLSTADESASASSIVLHGATNARLAAAIACYLNEYDDEGDGRWISIPPELVAGIAADPSQRALLGIGESCVNCPPTSLCGQKKTLAALALRGHVVLDSPLAAAAAGELENTFHAGIGMPANGMDGCHLIVNPELLPENCIAHVVADVFLEWLACEDRRSARFERG